MKIGLVPISAKPYHAGHHALVTTASAENDEVLLYVSVSDRKRKGELSISGADMKKIWDEEIENILPGNVTPVYGGSPVRHVFDVLQNAEEKLVSGKYQGHEYTVYSDPTDTSQNYSTASRQKYFPTLDKINDFVGFMILFDKSEKIMFKIKEMKKKRNKGARCDQMPKKSVIPILNKIKGGKLYPELILDQEVPGEKKKKKISGGQFCCELELILRYYDDIGEKGMRWFLPTADVKLNAIETKTKN